MEQLNPAQYRHFIIHGVLLVQGEVLDVFVPCHADDLPAGEDGKTELAERVRKHYATQEGDPTASWQKVEVQELDPPDEMYEVPKGTL